MKDNCPICGEDQVVGREGCWLCESCGASWSLDPNKTVPKSEETWQHFKGQFYTIVAIAKHSETKEEMVVYRKLNGDDIWARPLAMFIEVAQVKPTLPGNPNCQHPPQFHYLDTIEEDFMYCSACEGHAKIGRFVRTSPAPEG